MEIHGESTGKDETQNAEIESRQTWTREYFWNNVKFVAKYEDFSFRSSALWKIFHVFVVEILVLHIV